MQSQRTEVLLETDSKTLRQCVNNALVSLGIDVRDRDNQVIALRIVDCEQSASSRSLHSDHRPLVLLGNAKQGSLHPELVEKAVASLPIPFLSNDLRKTVGRVLKLSVLDAEIYDRADRPVPIATKVARTQPKIREPDLVKTQVIPPQLPVQPSVSTPVDTAADLPQVSVHAGPEIPSYDTESVRPIEKQEMPALDNQTLQTISAEYVEKVVWEVVPRLAERILREEIARLLKEKIEQ